MAIIFHNVTKSKSPSEPRKIFRKYRFLVYIEVELSIELDEIIDWCIENFDVPDDEGRRSTLITNVRGNI